MLVHFVTFCSLVSLLVSILVLTALLQCGFFAFYFAPLLCPFIKCVNIVTECCGGRSIAVVMVSLTFSKFSRTTFKNLFKEVSCPLQFFATLEK